MEDEFKFTVSYFRISVNFELLLDPRADWPVAIESMRHWSQGSLQSPIQNVKKGAFWRHFGGLFEPSPPLAGSHFYLSCII
jgi:hypothetical protein